jgi:hypothetical protein
MEQTRKTNVRNGAARWQRLFWLTLMVVCSTVAMAQSKVTGTVTDAQGEPVIGASVMVKGTTTGTVTDLDGKFTLQGVPSKGALVVSYVGYSTQTVSVGGKSTRWPSAAATTS